MGHVFIKAKRGEVIVAERSASNIEYVHGSFDEVVNNVQINCTLENEDDIDKTIDLLLDLKNAFEIK